MGGALLGPATENLHPLQRQRAVLGREFFFFWIVTFMVCCLYVWMVSTRALTYTSAVDQWFAMYPFVFIVSLVHLLSCRRSRRILYCFSFFLHSRSRRLCFVSVRFLSSVNISKSYISDMTWPILTRLGHKYRLTIPFMSYDQIGVKGHVGVTGVKKVIFTKKKFQVQQVT